jgi:hypothetical protein
LREMLVGTSRDDASHAFGRRAKHKFEV